MKQERPESDETPQQSGQFDIASKQIVRQNPDECIQFYLGQDLRKLIKYRTFKCKK